MSCACSPCTGVVKIGSVEWLPSDRPRSQTEDLRGAVECLGAVLRDDGDAVTVLDRDGGVVGEAWDTETGWEWRVGPTEGREFHYFANEVTNVLQLRDPAT